MNVYGLSHDQNQVCNARDKLTATSCLDHLYQQTLLNDEFIMGICLSVRTF